MVNECGEQPDARNAHSNRKSLVTNRTGSSLSDWITRNTWRTTAFPFYFHPLSPCYRTQNFGLQLLIQRSILLKKTMIWPSIIWLTYAIPKLVTCLWLTTYKIHIMIPLFQFRFHPICPTLFIHRSYTILQKNLNASRWSTLTSTRVRETTSPTDTNVNIDIKSSPGKGLGTFSWSRFLCRISNCHHSLCDLITVVTSDLLVISTLFPMPYVGECIGERGWSMSTWTFYSCWDLSYNTGYSRGGCWKTVVAITGAVVDDADLVEVLEVLEVLVLRDSVPHKNTYCAFLKLRPEGLAAAWN